jgi:hypothetical protein
LKIVILIGLLFANEGQKARVTTSNGVYYVIYVVEGNADLVADGFTLKSPPGTSATLRFARVKNIAQEGVLDSHSSTIPTGLTMSYNVGGIH